MAHGLDICAATATESTTGTQDVRVRTRVDDVCPRYAVCILHAQLCTICDLRDCCKNECNHLVPAHSIQESVLSLLFLFLFLTCSPAWR